MPTMIDRIRGKRKEAGISGPNVPEPNLLAPVHAPSPVDPQDINLDEYASKVISAAGQSGISLGEAEEIVSLRNQITKMRERNKIGFVEAALQDIETKIPFSPAGAYEALDLLWSIQRLKGDDYETPPTFGAAFPDIKAIQLAAISPDIELPVGAKLPELQWTPEKQKARDVRLIENYLEKMAEREERGYTGMGKFGAIMSQMPAWMIEFGATGGLATIKGKTAKQYLTSQVKHRLAKGLGTLFVGTAKRVTLGMSHRVTEAITKRLIEDPEKWATAICLGWGEVYIEALTESVGELVSPVGRAAVQKLPFGKKLLGGLEAAWLGAAGGRTSLEFARRVGTKAGFNGVVIETGEERLATLLHGLVGTEDFGAGDEAGPLARIIAGFKQDWENKWVELGAFSTISSGQLALGKVAGAGKEIQRRKTLVEIVRKYNKQIVEIEKQEDLTEKQKEKTVESLLAAAGQEIEKVGAEAVVEEAEEELPDVMEDELEVPEDLMEREPYKLAEGEKAITKEERTALQDRGLSLQEIARLSPDEARAVLETEAPAIPSEAVEAKPEGKMDAYSARVAKDIVKKYEDKLARGEKLRDFEQESLDAHKAMLEAKPVTAAPVTDETSTARQEQTGTFIEPTQDEITDTNKVLRAQLRQARRLRRDEVEPAISEMHKRQVARAAAIGEKAAERGMAAAEVIRRSKAGYKDKAAVPEITPPELSESQWDIYARKVYNVYPPGTAQFKQTDSQDALDRLRSGKILTNYEVGLLVPIVGMDMATELEKSHGKFRSPAQQKWDVMRDIILMWKTPFAFDVQFVRQAISFAPRHPVRYTKGVGKAIGAYFSHQFADRLIAEVENNPNHADAANYINFIRSDIFAPITERAEQFRGRGPERLAEVGAKRGIVAKTLAAPLRGFGKWYLASERSMTASCNWFFQSLWDSKQEKWNKSLKLLEAEGLSKTEHKRILDNVEKEKKKYGDTLNTFMKILRAKSTTGKQIQGVANLILWSPSMTWARIKRPKTLLNNPVYAAELITGDIAKIYLVATIVPFIANQFRDEDDQIKVELDPRSSNWGKIHVGDTWYDLGGGEVQYYRTLAQLAMGEVKNQAGRLSKQSRYKTLLRYTESRQTALIGVMQELLTGKTIFGEKVWEMPDWDEIEKEGTKGAGLIAGLGRGLEKLPGGKQAILMGRFTSRHLIPSFIQAFIESSILDGWPQSALATTSEALSMNVQSYKMRAKAELQMFQDDVARRLFQGKWEDLSEKEQSQVMEMEQAQDLSLEVRAEAGKFETAGDKFLLPEERKAKERIQARMSSFVKEDLDEVKMSAGGISRHLGEFRLNDERFAAYEQLASQHIEDALAKLFGKASYRRKSLAKKVKEIERARDEAKDKAREELRKEIDKGNI